MRKKYQRKTVVLVEPETTINLNLDENISGEFVEPTSIQEEFVEPIIQEEFVEPTSIQPEIVEPTSIQPEIVEPTSIQEDQPDQEKVFNEKLRLLMNLRHEEDSPQMKTSLTETKVIEENTTTFITPSIIFNRNSRVISRNNGPVSRGSRVSSGRTL